MMPRRFLCFFLWAMTLAPVAFGGSLSQKLHEFADLDEDLNQTPVLPTPNKNIYEEGELGFAARTRTNDQYGEPGWTRGNGGRFHKGVDILPVRFEKTDRKVRIDYYEPKTGRSFSVNEPVLVPKDEVFAILDGTVVVANFNEKRSGYGRYVMIQHMFVNGKPFISMYAHLNRLEVHEGDSVRAGDLIGWMGQTSSNSGGRDYLKAIPHCHFEVGQCINSNFASTMTAKFLFPRMLGGKFDPRNIQPFNPVEFLKHFQAQLSSRALASRSEPSLREDSEDSQFIRNRNAPN